MSPTGPYSTVSHAYARKPCPECGGEMEHAIGKKGTIAEGVEEWYCRRCGYCEDYYGHEERVI